MSVGGTTVQPAMYYATPGQIAAVLPSNTPTGSATITVSYNGATSNAFSFQVVPYALGINTYFGTGGGLILATDTSGSIFTYTNSAKPGQTIVLYGSGLGADTADSDTVFTTTPHAVNTPIKIYIGGIPATILYAGSSGYPGYNQIDLTIPDNVPTSCYVGFVGVTGSGKNITTTNFGSLAISPSGGQCNDSIFGHFRNYRQHPDRPGYGFVWRSLCRPAHPACEPARNRYDDGKHRLRGLYERNWRGVWIFERLGVFGRELFRK